MDHVVNKVDYFHSTIRTHQIVHFIRSLGSVFNINDTFHGRVH